MALNCVLQHRLCRIEEREHDPVDPEDQASLVRMRLNLFLENWDGLGDRRRKRFNSLATNIYGGPTKVRFMGKEAILEEGEK